MKFTPPPYNADIGPGGPDMNAKAGFKPVHTSMKQKMSPFFQQGETQPMQGQDQSEGQSTGAIGMGGARAPGVAVGAQSQQDSGQAKQVGQQVVQDLLQRKQVRL